MSTPWISPAVWLLGASGADGVSTIEHFLAFTADSEGAWPPGDDLDNVSPFVVIVARESFKGLAAAQRLVVAHRDGEVGHGAQLLGLVTVAAAPTLDKAIRQHRDVVSSAFDHAWHIGWHRGLLSAALPHLARWHPLDDGAVAAPRGIPADVHRTGVELVNTAHSRLPELFPAQSTDLDLVDHS